jgi:hypothetical protein
MSCNTMRQLEYQKQKEEERKRKRAREKEAEDKKREAEKKKLEKERYEKAIKTIKEYNGKLGWLVSSTGHPGKFRVTKPGSNDLMELEVMKNGKVRTNTPGMISQANHASADAFMDGLAKTLKGTWKIITRHFHGVTGGHVHTHTHEH